MNNAALHPTTRRPFSFWKRLLSGTMILWVWTPILAVSGFHYFTSLEHHHIHDILRRVYYLPIVVGAIQLGLRGGLFFSSVVSIAYLPHAFFLPHHIDPARGIEKALEISIYLLIGAVAGHLSDKERKHRIALEKALHTQEKLTRQLVRAGRLSALGETVAGIAHEIKNPLHSLLGTVEVVDSVIPKDCEERRLWEIHISEIERLKSVSERFLSFARPAAVTLRSLDLREVIHRVEALFAAQARQNNITLTSELPPAPVPIRGDQDQLAQLAINIFLNAQKALGADGGKIRLTAGTARRNEDEMAFLSIENDGPPIDVENIEHLFDPFYSGAEGTGLGLSISSRIAQQHDGFIQGENSGLGVSFTLYLPLQTAE